MPNILMGLTSHEQDPYAEELRNNGYGVSVVYSLDDLLGALSVTDEVGTQDLCRLYNIVVIEAGYLFNEKTGDPRLPAEIKSRVPQSGMFRTKILVFFPYWDERQAKMVCENPDINALVCSPTSPSDVHMRIRSLLLAHAP